MNATGICRTLMHCVVVSCVFGIGCEKSAPVVKTDPSNRSSVPSSGSPQPAISSAKTAPSEVSPNESKAANENDALVDPMESGADVMEAAKSQSEGSAEDPLPAEATGANSTLSVDEISGSQPHQDEAVSTPSSAYRIWIPTTRGPLLVGLDIHVGGRTLKQAYEEKRMQIVADLTSDGSSEIDWEMFLEYVAENVAVFGRDAPQVATNKKDLIKRYDRNVNQRVDADEMMKFVYRDVRFENELRIVGTDAFRWSNRSQSKLFAAMDVDQNGKLDQTETDQASAALARVVDVNSDGCIDLMEAALADPLSKNPWGRRRSHRQGDVAMDLSGFVNWANLSYAMGGMFESFLVEDSGSISGQASENKLASGSHAGLVGQLDQNADRNISSDEAASILELVPAFGIHLNLERTPGSGSRITLKPREDLESIVSVRHSGRQGWISTGSVNIIVVAHDTSTRPQSIPRIAFDQLDVNNDGGIDESEIPDGAEETLRFELLDQNQDGKLSYQEINQSVSPTESVWATQVRGRAAEFPSGVFAWLDSNHDMLLSEREIASTSTRLKELMNGDGENRQWIRPTDLPDTFLIQFGRGEPGEDETRFALSRETDSRVSSRPSWAVQMDSNRDGDISTNEFVGTLEQFQSMDRNNDHFIGVDEL